MYEPDPSYRAMGCAWGDYDSDGLLDLIVVRYFHEWKPGILDALDFKDAIRPLALYHNVANGRFEDVTHLLGRLTLPDGFRNGKQPGSVWGAGFQPVWADFDDDGDLDLYIANDFGFTIQPNVMWRNDGAGSDGAWRFSDISKTTGADLPMSGMGIALGDYDLDGDLDMYVTNIGVNVFLRNDGEGIRFSNVTAESASGIPNVGVSLRVAWSAMFFDYDNDGDEDLYVISGNIPGVSNIIKTERQPNALLRNEGDGTFTNVSRTSGANHAGSGTRRRLSRPERRRMSGPVRFQFQRKAGAAEEHLRQRQPLAEADAHGQREQSRRHRREDHRDRQRRQAGAPHIWRIRSARSEHADRPLWPGPGNERRQSLYQVAQWQGPRADRGRRRPDPRSRRAVNRAGRSTSAKAPLNIAASGCGTATRCPELQLSIHHLSHMAAVSRAEAGSFQSRTEFPTSLHIYFLLCYNTFQY